MFQIFLRYNACHSRGERLLASLSNAQDLVALELGEAGNDCLGQGPDGCSLIFQSGALFDVVLLPLDGAAPTRGHTADAAATRGTPTDAAPTWGKPLRLLPPSWEK